MDETASAEQMGAMTDFVFFSSRSRHTISDRDWSSDVCSSDLVSSTTNLPTINTAKLATAPIQSARCFPSASIRDSTNASETADALHRIVHAICLSCHARSEEHTSELQSRSDLVCRLLLAKKTR